MLEDFWKLVPLSKWISGPLSQILFNDEKIQWLKKQNFYSFRDLELYIHTENVLSHFTLSSTNQFS